MKNKDATSKTDELKSAAKKYFLQGLNIIPLKGKQPLVKWTKWQNQKQTKKEFENLPWKTADSFALIGGSQLRNGVYIGAVDFDVKNLPKAVIDIGRKILKEFPMTQVEETVNGGQHWIYFSKAKPKTLTIYHEKCSLELLGENKLIIMAPSKGYKQINDKDPIVVSDLESLFVDALTKAGIRTSNDATVWFERKDFAVPGYSGPDPICIKELLQGVKNGERNETAIRLASYLINFKKLSKDEAWNKLLEWNRKNQIPLEEDELRTVLASAQKHNYIYGCNDKLLSQHCARENCPLAKETILVPKDVVKKEVERILTSENPISEIRKHLDNLIAGEEENKLALFILLLSGKFSEASMKQMILLKGDAGAGKSTLMNVASFFKTKDVARFSPHALDYTDLTGYEVLSLKELGNMDEEKQGISPIKFLSSDDKGYKVVVTVKNKDTEGFSTKEYKIPPITIISSTTRISLDPQFLRRNWIFNPDESEEQTERVLHWKAERESELNKVTLGIKTYTSYDFSKEVLHHLVQKLEPCTVVVPFPETLAELLNPSVLRVRGDYDKIIAFVKLYSFLIQHKLPKKEVNGRKIIFATPEACIDALRIAIKALRNMSSNLEGRTQKLIEALEWLNVTMMGDTINKEKRKKIINYLGKSDKTIRNWFKEWEAVGYVSSTDEKPKKYVLLYDLGDIKEKMVEISAKLESADSLILKMQKEAKKTLSFLLETGNQGIEKNQECF